MPDPRSPNDDMLARRPPRRRFTALWVWLVLLIATAAIGRWYVWPRVAAWWAPAGEAASPAAADAAGAQADAVTNDMAGAAAGEAAAAAQDGQADALPAGAGAAPAVAAPTLESLRAALDAHKAGTDSALRGLSSSVAQIQQQVSVANTGEGRLAEVDHLLRLANAHAELESDPVTALRLVGAADALMVSSGDPRYLPVRAALAADLVQLRAQAAIDPERIYLRVNALANAVPSLPFRQPAFVPDARAQAAANDGLMARVLASLRGLVRVRDDAAQAAAPVLSREGQALARERAMLALEQAGTAALRGEPGAYVAALRRADTLLRQHARAESAQAAQVQRELASLLALQATRAPVHLTALDAMAQIPRMTPPGLLPSPEQFGAAPAASLDAGSEGVADAVVRALPAAVPPPASARPAAAPVPAR